MTASFPWDAPSLSGQSLSPDVEQNDDLWVDIKNCLAVVAYQSWHSEINIWSKCYKKNDWPAWVQDILLMGDRIQSARLFHLEEYESYEEEETKKETIPSLRFLIKKSML